MRVLDYNAEQLWTLRGTLPDAPFASVDPGKVGAAIGWASPADAQRDRKPQLVFPLTAGLETVGAGLAALGVRVIFIEAQHSKSNPSVALKLAREASYLPGFIQARLPKPLTLTVIWVHPASWHGELRRRLGRPLKTVEDAKGKKKSEAKARAMDEASGLYNGDGRYEGAAAAQREGIAEATMLGCWGARNLWHPAGAAQATDGVVVGIRSRE